MDEAPELSRLESCNIRFLHLRYVKVAVRPRDAKIPVTPFIAARSIDTMGSRDDVLVRVADFAAKMTKDLQEKAQAEEESKVYRHEKLEKERRRYQAQVAARLVGE